MSGSCDRLKAVQKMRACDTCDGCVCSYGGPVVMQTILNRACKKLTEMANTI